LEPLDRQAGFGTRALEQFVACGHDLGCDRVEEIRTRACRHLPENLEGVVGLAHREIHVLGAGFVKAGFEPRAVARRDRVKSFVSGVRGFSGDE
jgi:hypothetical protein